MLTFIGRIRLSLMEDLLKIIYSLFYLFIRVLFLLPVFLICCSFTFSQCCYF